MPRHTFTICLATLTLAFSPAATLLAQPERSTSRAASEQALLERLLAERGGPERTAPERTPADKLPLSGRAITFEIVIAEFVKGGKGPAAVDLESPEKALLKLKEMESAGEVGALTRFNLSAVELSPARIQIGERRPVVTSRGGFGGRAPGVVEGPVSYSMESIGTLVTALSRVTDDGAVLAEIAVEKTRPALTLAKPSEPDVSRARSSTTSTQATVLIPPGQWVVLGGAQGQADDESSQTIVLVSAKATPAAKAGPQVRVFALMHAKAADLLKVVSTVVSEKTVRLTFDERTNSLIASGTASDLETIEALIAKLDGAK